MTYDPDAPIAPSFAEQMRINFEATKRYYAAMAAEAEGHGLRVATMDDYMVHAASPLIFDPDAIAAWQKGVDEMFPSPYKFVFEFGNENWRGVSILRVSKRRYRRLRGKARGLGMPLRATLTTHTDTGLYREDYAIVGRRGWREADTGARALALPRSTRQRTGE